MDDEEAMQPGTRVRLRDNPFGAQLRSMGGYIERLELSSGYYIVQLDEPAIYFHADGTTEDLPAIREAGDNLIPEPQDDFESLADFIADHFEEHGITRADVEDAVRWARKG